MMRSILESLENHFQAIFRRLLTFSSSSRPHFDLDSTLDSNFEKHDFFTTVGFSDWAGPRHEMLKLIRFRPVGHLEYHLYVVRFAQ